MSELSQSLSVLIKRRKWKDKQYKLDQVIFKKVWCYEMLILSLDHVVNSKWNEMNAVKSEPLQQGH